MKKKNNSIKYEISVNKIQLLPIWNMSRKTTSIKGTSPKNVATFGSIDWAESILSKIYDTQVANKILAGQ